MPLETDFQIPTQLLDPNHQSCAAVTRCCDAWNRSFKSESMKREPYGPALRDARAAYFKAMPPLVGYENIRDFIACVAQALLLGAITESESSRLLYAAQVAQGTLRYQPAESLPHSGTFDPHPPPEICTFPHRICRKTGDRIPTISIHPSAAPVIAMPNDYVPL